MKTITARFCDHITAYRYKKCPPVAFFICSNNAVIPYTSIFIRETAYFGCVLSNIYFRLNEVDQSISDVFNGTNQPG